MRNQYKRYLFLFFSLAALLMGLSGTGVAFAQGHTRLASSQKAASQSCGTWSIIPSPDATTKDNELNGVAAVSATDVWAVGYYLNDSDSTETLIEHWDGTNWSIVSSPNPTSSTYSELLGVAAESANDVWAVGDYFNGTDNQTLIEQWNGTKWSIVPSPNTPSTYNFLYSVAAHAASDVWAVGYDEYQGIRALIEHWNGTKWSLVSSPNPGPQTLGYQLYSVTAIEANDVWAVGDGNETLVEHWNGTKWSVVGNPRLSSGPYSATGVAAVFPGDAWLVGYYANPNFVDRTLIEHWDGTKWSVVPSPNASSNLNYLNSVAAVSVSDVWTVGLDFNGYQRTLIEHWDGTKWSVVPSPNVASALNNLNSVAVDSSGDVWAVGYYHINSPSSRPPQTLIESYCS